MPQQHGVKRDPARRTERLKLQLKEATGIDLTNAVPSHKPCRAAPSLFYADAKGDNAMDYAKLFCALCTCRLECLERGFFEVDGVWGGTSPLERRALRDRPRTPRQH